MLRKNSLKGRFAKAETEREKAREGEVLRRNGHCAWYGACIREVQAGSTLLTKRAFDVLRQGRNVPNGGSGLADIATAEP